MSLALICFIASGSAIIIMVGLKALVFKDSHIHPWVKVRQFTDSYIHKSITYTSDTSQKVTHQSLLKMIALVYHGFIPIVEYCYRKIASALYKLHRRLWTFLEYSKHSTHNVSEYLQNLSEDRAAEKKDESVTPTDESKK